MSSLFGDTTSIVFVLISKVIGDYGRTPTVDGFAVPCLWSDRKSSRPAWALVVQLRIYF